MNAEPGRILVDRSAADETVVRLAGEFDINTKDALVQALLDAVADTELTTVDLTDVTFFDSSGVNALVTAHRAAVQSGRKIRTYGAGRSAAAVLHQSGLTDLLE